MRRRPFLASSLLAALAAAARAGEKRAPRILLRSSWQTVNIGDIAHTPGVLALLEKHLPGAEVRLWPSSVDNGVKEQDCAPLRAAIERVAAETDLRVLLCPEDRTQMAVNKEMILDRLPTAARARCVWREHYWLTDEALSTYRRSAGLFGHEMHSPILCIGSGVPALVCRWAEQTSKGIMWRDIGLGEWLFDFDRAEERARLPDVVLALAKDPAAARLQAERGRATVHRRQRETMDRLRASLP